MDKKIYDLHIKLRRVDKKFYNKEFKDVIFRMENEKSIMEKIQIFYRIT